MLGCVIKFKTWGFQKSNCDSRPSVGNELMLIVGKPGCAIDPCRKIMGVVVEMTIAVIVGSGTILAVVTTLIVPVCVER